MVVRATLKAAGGVMATVLGAGVVALLMKRLMLGAFLDAAAGEILVLPTVMALLQLTVVGGLAWLLAKHLTVPARVERMALKILVGWLVAYAALTIFDDRYSFALACTEAARRGVKLAETGMVEMCKVGGFDAVSLGMMRFKLVVAFVYAAMFGLAWLANVRLLEAMPRVKTRTLALTVGGLAVAFVLASDGFGLLMFIQKMKVVYVDPYNWNTEFWVDVLADAMPRWFGLVGLFMVFFNFAVLFVRMWREAHPGHRSERVKMPVVQEKGRAEAEKKAAKPTAKSVKKPLAKAAKKAAKKTTARK